MRLGKGVQIKVVYTTMLFLIFSVCTFEHVPALPALFSVTGGCDTAASGPWSGDLEHTDEETIDDSRNMSVSVTVKDFIAEATFSNPYSASRGKWDYGFLFRISGNTSYAIQVAYDGTWRHILLTGGKHQIIDQGVVSLQPGANQKNQLRIIVVGNSGAFYVNGQFIEELDTSELNERGDVRAATGIDRNYVIPGEATRCEGFTVWSLDIPLSDPLRGSLEDKKDGKIEFSSAGVNVKDFIAEATFYNPYSASTGSWNYGFLFRSTKEDTSYAIQVTSDNTWSHALKIGEEWHVIGQGTLTLRTEANQNNRLRIIVIGNSGWFYVDDQYVASLGTSGLTESGDVCAATGIIVENEIEGESTRYEDFVIWSLDGCPELSRYGVRDRDDDGVPDDRDDCYNPGCTKVGTDGCPLDTDADGVNDCDDECPLQEGPVENNGCSVDRDNDGVTDDSDNCYNPECTLVDENGCPTDTDSDGVDDCRDECPSEYGKRDNGCPDADNDGVPDHEDDCEDSECALVDEKGCPTDTDSDGVDDCKDECPSEYGKRECRGCPDADDDGVRDLEDACEDSECTLVDEKGCPTDTDSDGVDDCKDECPSEYGKTEHNGCPDTDNDGVPDPEDECPSEYGKRGCRGCPDADDDGVRDNIDECKNPNCTLVDETGCPIDSDSDNVGDCYDDCPDVYGDPNHRGCPPSPYKNIVYAIIITAIVIIITVGITIQRKRKSKETAKKRSGKTTCPFCENEIEETWVSCPYCGIKLKEDTQTY